MSKEANDKLIKDLLNRIKSEQEVLGKRKKAVLNTNGIFKYNELANNYININTVSNHLVLVNALSFILREKESFEKACQILQVDDTFKWDNFTIDDWINDFKARIEIIQYDEKKKKLDDMKLKLSSLISEEAKTELELENIQKMLGV